MKQMLVWGVVFCLWSSFAMADEQQVQQEQEIVEALQLVGMEAQFNDLHEVIRRGLNQRRYEGVAPGALSYEALEQLIDQNFEAALLTRQLAKRLLPMHDTNRFQLLLSSLRSEQIQTIRQRLEAVMKEENSSNLHSFSLEYDEQLLDRQRAHIIDGLDRASAGNELNAGVQAMATLTLLRMQETQEGVGAQFPEERLLQQLYNDYLESGRKANEIVYRSALGEMSAESLQLSLRVYRSTVVQWFLGEAVDNMIPVVTEQRERLLKAIEGPSAVGS